MEVSDTKIRPSWDEYFFKIAEDVATRGTCNRLAVGAVLVRDNRILTTGYNGSPSGTLHCLEVGCLMVNNHCVRSTHAEANAIAQAARHGVSLENSRCYVTHAPCVNCTKLLISAGVKCINYDKFYADEAAAQLRREAGIEFINRVVTI